MDILLTDSLGYDVWEVEDIPNTKSPIWILGKSYSFEELEKIRNAVHSVLWCTYRKGFPSLGSPSMGYTSDKGFGCMMRCGQMLLAEALKRLHLEPDWLWTKETNDENYLKIVNRFEDNPEAPFGIHQIATAGVSLGRKIAEWYSPNSIAQVLKNLVCLDNFSNLRIHVALDHELATEEVFDVQDSSKFQPLMIIIPLRLGLNEVNPVYINGLKKCLEIESSLGIIGGKPNQALYFIGYVDDDILYLDPHTVQRSGSVGPKETKDEVEMDETYHQRFPGRMAFNSMCPSIALSFLCKTRIELELLIEQLGAKDGETPLFEITKSRARPWMSTSTATTSKDLEVDLDVICGAHSLGSEEFEEVSKEDGSDDEFEIV